MNFYVHETDALFIAGASRATGEAVERLIAKEEASRFIDRMFKEMKAAWDVQNERLKKEVNEKWSKR